MAREIQTTIDLLIGQWQGSPKLRSLVTIYRDLMVKDVLPAIETLQLQRQIEKAEGVHLDAIGRRLGLLRPSTQDRAQDARWGFDEAGEAFDQVPFAGDAANDAVFPLPDAAYRRLLRARAITLLSDGTIAALAESVRAIDPGADVQDNRNMTVRVVTSQRALLELADSSRALARNAGVQLIYGERGRFGFDEAGVGFDQGPYATE